MILYFIRHGEPDYQNDSLTKVGHQQAKKLAEHIDALMLDEIYASPMGRAVQTAAYSAENSALRRRCCRGSANCAGAIIPATHIQPQARGQKMTAISRSVMRTLPATLG